MSDLWHEILRAARDAGKGGNAFSASDLARAAELKKGSEASVESIAYAWIAKFLKWGYVRRGPSAINPVTRRSIQTYVVTEAGEKCELTEGGKGKLWRLIAAVTDFEKARGTRAEAAKLAALLKTRDDVSPKTEASA